MDPHFEFITSLQYEVRSLRARVRAYESGKKYTSIKAEHKSQLAEKDREITTLRIELGDANCRTVTMRKNYQQVIEDMEDEHKRALTKKDREIEAMEERALRAERQRDAAETKATERNRELYQALTELEEEKGKNHKLKAQINRDYENSSISSSMKPAHKKICNNREKTDRKRGGQPGHKGHGRKRLAPTNTIHIPAPEEYADSKEYRPTGRMVSKQVVGISVDVIVDEYTTAEFRNVRTGQRVHARFPDGVINDVSYGGSVKALAFLLNSRYCVSIDKVREFLSEITDGKLEISKGMVSGLCKEFSGKTEPERKALFADMLLSPVMNTDFTAARVDGKNVQVIVCATPGRAIYSARKHKGHEGVKGTPACDYQGILIHDHDKTFYSYGGGHQECLAHSLRYLKDSMINEPALTWNKQMRGLIQEMIHYRNRMGDGDEPDSTKVNEYEARYQETLQIGKEEYEYEPPSDYYRDGYNLFKRLGEYKDNHLLFLHDKRVPVSNNLSERLLRVFKRKQKQAMTFRSFESLGYLCDSMGMIESFRSQEQNLYKSVSAVFAGQ